MEIGIRQAVLNDAKILFDWANDPVTRQNSFNSSTIDWLDHVYWFKNKLTSQTSKIYILQIKGTPIGVVRFDLIEITTIGITIAPIYRGMKLGAELIKIACNSYWENKEENIFAIIKKENEASRRVFEKAGFEIQREEILNGHECLILKADFNDKR